MLISLHELTGYRLRTTEPFGHAGDFLFDDTQWTIRYVVADTGDWLPGRKVLISPAAIGDPIWKERLLPTNLTTEQVEDSPPLSADMPVSRQHEADLARHYGWPAYWPPPMTPFPPPVPCAPEEDETGKKISETAAGDQHLRSFKEVENYRVHASDGEIGHIHDLIADTDEWVIRYAVIDTRNWLPGRKVLIPPAWAERIDWAGGEAHVTHTREEVRKSPEFDSAAPINREYEIRLYDYYGRPAYWN